MTVRASLWRWLNGSVRLRVEGGLGERFLNECARLGAVIEDVVPTEFGFELNTSPADLSLMYTAAKKCRCEVRILSRYGAPFRLSRFRTRFGIAAGALLAVGILLWEPRSVWNIDFYDFTPEQEKQIRSLLYEHGICEGIRAESAQLNVAESNILAEQSEFGWLQLNFVHGRLVVEKTVAVPAPEMQTQQELTSLVAAQEGIVRGFDLMGGYIQVDHGQAVVKGDLLVNAATVGKRTGKILYSAAKGIVWGEVQHVFRCFVPYEQEIRAPTGSKLHNYALITPVGRIPLGRKQQAEPVETETSYQPVTLLGLHIPATLEVETLRLCAKQSVVLTEKQAEDIARSRIYDSLNDMVEEYEILNREETIDSQDNGVLVTMRFTLLCDIATPVPYTSSMEPEIPSDLW